MGLGRDGVQTLDCVRTMDQIGGQKSGNKLLERKHEQCLKKFHRKEGRKLTKIENGNKGTLQKKAEGKRNTRSPMTTHSKQDVIMLAVMVAQL